MKKKSIIFRTDPQYSNRGYNIFYVCPTYHGNLAAMLAGNLVIRLSVHLIKMTILPLITAGITISPKAMSAAVGFDSFQLQSHLLGNCTLVICVLRANMIKLYCLCQLRSGNNLPAGLVDEKRTIA